MMVGPFLDVESGGSWNEEGGAFLKTALKLYVQAG